MPGIDQSLPAYLMLGCQWTRHGMGATCERTGIGHNKAACVNHRTADMHSILAVRWFPGRSTRVRRKGPTGTFHLQISSSTAAEANNGARATQIGVPTRSRWRVAGPRDFCAHFTSAPASEGPGRDGGSARQGVAARQALRRYSMRGRQRHS